MRMKSQPTRSGDPIHRAGYVAIVGRPNVGKSTLLNRAVGQKISIVSRKPQTTRLPVTGIVTRKDAQIVFVDTPGYQTEYRSPLNRQMNRTVTSALREVHAVLWVVEALKFDHRDATVEEQLPPALPVVVAVNKIDQVAQKNLLLPFLARFSGQEKFSAIVPVSAGKGTQVEELLDTVVALLPEGPRLFDDDEITTVSERVLAAELLREKLFRFLGGEVPYATAVVIDQFKAEPNLHRLDATILVERETQKGMIVGKHGDKLKTIATEARKDMEALFGTKVFLTVWVKVRKGWTSNPAAIEQLGYGE